MTRPLPPLPIVLALLAMLMPPAWAGSYDNILVAARDNRTQEVMQLLMRGMDPNTSDRSGTTLLMYAAGNGNVELIDFLVRARCNLGKPNQYGDTAIGLAALRGHIQAVQRLQEAGAPLDGRNWNPLHYAAFSGHEDIVRLLVGRKAPLDARAPNRQTALMLAARNGHEGVVHLLVEAGADPGLTDDEGRNARDIAAAGNHRAIAEYLTVPERTVIEIK